MKRRCTGVFVGLAIIASAVSLFAQTHFASVTGTITSTDGTPVADVEVVATNAATQVTYPTKTNSDGLYTIPALPIGTYKVRAQAQGFQPPRPTRSSWNRARPRASTSSCNGGRTEIEVTGVSPILQTQDAVVGEVISETTIRGMPLNGRNFSQLSLLLPGVMTTAPDTFAEPKNFGQGRPYVNGQREQENNFTLDGVDMNEAVDNLLPYQPSPDALAEVRVETNNYSAEFGNVAGAVIGSTIKSGTNDFHGNGFEYRRDSSMAANTWDNNRAGAKKAELSQHIFGGTFGGPLVSQQDLLLRRLSGLHPRSSGRAGRHSRAAGLAQRRLLQCRRHHSRSADRTALPGQHHPVVAFQPDRAGGAGEPDALSAADAQHRHQQLRGGLLAEAADASGRREGRRQPVRSRSPVRPRLAAEVHL